MSLLSELPLNISRYGYPALLAGCVVEGPIASIVGGFLASLGLIGMGAVFGISVVGDLVGDLLCYGFGRYATTWSWLQRKFGKRRHAIDALRATFHRAPAKTLLFGKWLHAPGFAVLAAAGAFRMPLGQFLGYNLLATLPKSAVLVLVGYACGAAYERIGHWVFLASMIIFAGFVIGVAGYLRRVTERSDAHRDLHG